MQEYSGVVQKVIDRNGPGGKVFYSFTLSGQDGFFGTGTKKPPAVGTSISFSAGENAAGYLQADTKTIQYKSDGAVGPASVVRTASQAKAGGKSVEEKGYWEKREAREVRNDNLRELGASRNTAIALIDLMIKNEAVPLPKTVAKREEFLFTLLDTYVGKLMGKGTETVIEEPAKEDVTTMDENWE